MKIFHFLLATILLISMVSCHTSQRASSRGNTLAASAPSDNAIASSAAVSSAPVQKSEPVSEGNVMQIVKPAQLEQPQNSPLTSPVEVCMKINGYTVEPAKNGDNEGKGHHHILIDVPLPTAERLGQRLPKDEFNLHLGNGADCKKLNLKPGLHTIRSIFSYGSHNAYNPPITDSVIIFVK